MARNGYSPTCSEPLVLPATVDLSLVSGILYPRQERGNDYKPHGGFRFDNQTNNEVNVYSPMDGKLLGTIEGKYEPGVIYTAAIMVTKDARGRGISTMLIDHAELYGKKTRRSQNLALHGS